jgi:RNA polymerase sigma factor (sigma-70 family)
MARRYQKTNWLEIVDEVNSGDYRKKQTGNEKACKALKGFILKLAAKKYPTYLGNECHDFMQEAYVAVMEALPKYDPVKGAPTTFFAPYIEHAMLDWMIKNVAGFTIYYQTMFNKIKGVLKEHPNWDDKKVSKATGVSHVTVGKVRENLAATEKFSLDERFESVAVEKLSLEEEFEKAEQEKILHKWIGELLANKEREVIFALYGFNGSQCLSVAELARKRKVPKSDIESVKDSALRKLRNSGLLMELVGESAGG